MGTTVGNEYQSTYSLRSSPVVLSMR